MLITEATITVATQETLRMQPQSALEMATALGHAGCQPLLSIWCYDPDTAIVSAEQRFDDYVRRHGERERWNGRLVVGPRVLVVDGGEPQIGIGLWLRPLPEATLRDDSNQLASPALKAELAGNAGLRYT